MTDLNHETFDIRDALGGRTYPKDSILVHQDAATDYLIAESNETVGKLRKVGDKEGARELEERIRGLVEEAGKTALTFHVQAIADDERDLLVDAALAKYPEELDALGRPKENNDRSNYFTNLLWAAHIKSIEAAGGKDDEVDVDKVVALRASLPGHAKRQVTDAIDNLYQGAARGYQQAIQETGFSSAVSPGA